MITEKDYSQIKSNNLEPKDIQNQLKIYQKGNHFMDLYAAAKIDHGIRKISQKEESFYLSFYNENRNSFAIEKFIPASGAASRMFKFLFPFLNNYTSDKTIFEYINRNKAKDLEIFLHSLSKFPFFKEVLSHVKSNIPDFSSLSQDEKRHLFIKELLENPLFDYAHMPKGLLPFHSYNGNYVSAFEEHIYESLQESSSTNYSLHFTINEKALGQFQNQLKKVYTKLSEKEKNHLKVSFSFQDKSTDFIATNLDGSPYRDEKDRLFFRPGGHGALLKNLNTLDADIIFIRNIDNIPTQSKSNDLIKYQKIFSALLIETRDKIFYYLNQLEQIDNPEKDLFDEISSFLSNTLTIPLKKGFKKQATEHKINYLTSLLNRPIRICGMVKNEGALGGGPFWVRGKNGQLSLQIVEQSQIDLDNPAQKIHFDNSTHFNPVNMACCIKDYRGNKFDLQQFMDPNAYFIATKNVGKTLVKSIELPGLWNGSMSRWNTLFIEMPITTFNPVKCVNDLLRPAHQQKVDLDSQ